MKFLYQTNKWLVIINALLFIIPFFGLLFSIILGAAQVIMALIIAYNIKKLNTRGKTKFGIYVLFSSIVLMLIKIMPNPNDDIVIITLALCVLLALLHLNITYLLYKTK